MLDADRNGFVDEGDPDFSRLVLLGPVSEVTIRIPKPLQGSVTLSAEPRDGARAPQVPQKTSGVLWLDDSTPSPQPGPHPWSVRLRRGFMTYETEH